jgi:hypothetical protein
MVSVHLKTLGAGGVAQVVQRLPSKHEALISNPSTTKKYLGDGSYP